MWAHTLGRAYEIQNCNDAIVNCVNLRIEETFASHSLRQLEKQLRAYRRIEDTNDPDRATGTIRSLEDRNNGGFVVVTILLRLLLHNRLLVSCDNWKSYLNSCQLLQMQNFLRTMLNISEDRGALELFNREKFKMAHAAEQYLLFFMDYVHKNNIDWAFVQTLRRARLINIREYIFQGNEGLLVQTPPPPPEPEPPAPAKQDDPNGEEGGGEPQPQPQPQPRQRETDKQRRARIQREERDANDWNRIVVESGGTIE